MLEKLPVSCRAMVAKGLDPKLERQKPAEPTFAECCEVFLAANESSWSNAKHIAQWRMTLTAYCKKIADHKISEITLTDVRDTLAPIWTEKPETVSRLRGRIERVFDHAIAEGWRDTTNPAQWRGGLKALLPTIQKKTVKHFDAMKYSKVPAFFEKLSGTRH